MARTDVFHSLARTVERDLWRYHGRTSTALLVRSVIGRRTFRPLFWLRVYQAARAGGGAWRAVVPMAWLLHRWSCQSAALELPLTAEIGPGLRIIHGFGLVVNGSARIGSNVTLFHGVTIGQRDRISEAGRSVRLPRIGDGAMIAAYAQILGVSVGDEATIAPQSVVRFDVPARALVAGNPARIEREHMPADIRHLYERDHA